MILFRSLIYFILLVLSTVLFSLPLNLISWFIPFSWRCRIANGWGKSNLWLLGVICGLKYEIHGWENLPKGNAIILSKHQSAWETIALRGLLPPEQAWVLKRELFWIPLFGLALKAVEPIAINRKATKGAIKQLMRDGIDRLRKDRWVIIFPEGTRVAPGQQRRYGAGGALLAEHSGYPIIPIAHNAGVFWGRREIKKYPGTIQIVIGPVIESTGRKASEINKEVEAWIESTVAKLPQKVEDSRT